MPESLNYPNYKMASGWNALLPPRKANTSLTDHIEANVVIIGAGFTGIAAAKRWALHSPKDRIIVLDSSEIGEGNPGRNSGFLLEVSLAEDANHKQIERMSKTNELLSLTMQEIVSDVEVSGNVVDLKRAGTFRAAAGSVGLKSLANYRRFLEAASLPFEELSKSQLQEKIGTSYFQEGLYSPHCYLAQPAQLIRALADTLPPSIGVFENSPAESLYSSNGLWKIKTPNGSISSKNVILANNAFAKNLGVGNSRLVAMYTYAAMTKVLDQSLLESLGSETNWGLLPTHRLGSTLRRTIDGRILIRSHHGYEKEESKSQVSAELKRRLNARFPQLVDSEFEQVWGGAVGFTHNGGSLWGKVKPGLYVSAGCNGGGTVKGTLLGNLIADYAHEIETPDVANLFGSASWMPPEPLRSIGFHATSLVDRYIGRAER